MRFNLKLSQLQDTVKVPLEALDGEGSEMDVVFEMSIAGMTNYMLERPAGSTRHLEEFARARAMVLTGKSQGPHFQKTLKDERKKLADDLTVEGIQSAAEESDRAHRAAFAKNVIVGWEGLHAINADDQAEPFPYSQENAEVLFSGDAGGVIFLELVGRMMPKVIEWTQAKNALVKNSKASSGGKKSRPSGGAKSTARRKKSTKRNTAKRKAKRKTSTRRAR